MSSYQTAATAELIHVRLAELLPHAQPEQLARIVDDQVLSLRQARELHSYLATHDDALTSGNSSGPAVHLRLLKALAAEYPEVQAARCASCAKIRPKLPYRGEHGRLCLPCYRDAQLTETCSRCGRLAPVSTRDPGGPICDRCRRNDPSRWEECFLCGSAKIVYYRVEGRPLCQSCGPRRESTCGTCGRQAPAHAITPAGPLCGRCYRRANQAECGICRRTVTNRRRNPDGTAVCERCWTPPVLQCVGCGEIKPCTRGSRTGRPTCGSCKSKTRPRRQCVRCRRPRRIHSRLPLGDVCGPCYTKIRRWPADCAACNQRRPLIGLDHQQRLIWGPCAGDGRDWICRRCGRFAALFSNGNCPHCVARYRLHRLLAGPDGHPHPQLTTLRKLLEAELDTDPFVIILLIHNTDWARLLGQHREITHAVLDDQPPRRHVHYLRTILVNAGILPDRDEHIESTPVWLDSLLSGLPADTVQIIRPYATWFVLRRARARARHRPATRSVRKYIRTRIVGALTFLIWLDQRELTLGTVTQADVEIWLEGGGNGRYRLREFLTWAAARGLTHSTLDVPWLGRGELRDVLDDDQRWELLQRCLTDESLGLPIRAAGALILLFGMVPTKITALTANDLTTNDGRTYLTIDSQPVLLPPRLGALLTELAVATPTGRRPRVELPTGPRLLFPGTHPGRPVDPDRLSSTLNQQLGLRIRPARNAALCALAADLPAPVLADLLGLHINTAVRWVHLVRRDWTDYLAARKALTTQNVRPDPYPPNSR